MQSLAVNITGATAGTALLAAPGAGKRIRVLGFFLVCSGTQTWKLQSASNDLFPAVSTTAAQPQTFGPNYDGFGMDCNVNEALNIVTTAGVVQLSGFVDYTIMSG